MVGNSSGGTACLMDGCVSEAALVVLQNANKFNYLSIRAEPAKIDVLAIISLHVARGVPRGIVPHMCRPRLGDDAWNTAS